MKSRVINTKHLTHYSEQKCFILKVGEFNKPSLFRGDKLTERCIWLQSYKTNKMTKWLLDESCSDDNIWVYKCIPKYVNDNAILGDYVIKVVWDTYKPKGRQTANYRNKGKRRITSSSKRSNSSLKETANQETEKPAEKRQKKMIVGSKKWNEQLKKVKQIVNDVFQVNKHKDYLGGC